MCSVVKCSPFNLLDSLVFCQLSYIDMQSFFSPEEETGKSPAAPMHREVSIGEIVSFLHGKGRLETPLAASGSGR